MEKRIIKLSLLTILIIIGGIGYALWCEYTGIGLTCKFHQRTGLLCPGCGITRMFISILKCDFKTAFYYNKAVFILLPYCIYLTIRCAIRYVKTGERRLDNINNKLIICIMIFLIAYGIIRNIVPYEYF